MTRSSGHFSIDGGLSSTVHQRVVSDGWRFQSVSRWRQNRNGINRGRRPNCCNKAKSSETFTLNPRMEMKATEKKSTKLYETRETFEAMPEEMKMKNCLICLGINNLCQMQFVCCHGTRRTCSVFHLQHKSTAFFHFTVLVSAPCTWSASPRIHKHIVALKRSEMFDDCWECLLKSQLEMSSVDEVLKFLVLIPATDCLV